MMVGAIIWRSVTSSRIAASANALDTMILVTLLQRGEAMKGWSTSFLGGSHNVGLGAVVYSRVLSCVPFRLRLYSSTPVDDQYAKEARWFLPRRQQPEGCKPSATQCTTFSSGNLD
jgi:hypothetical protein